VQSPQVLMNLVINGLDAMADVGGNLELASKSLRAENREHRVVAVSDSAVGPPPPQADQI
jgi:C4-dicarboxylate-specific signal transduction histidine kinase